jgi:hypothetical protein
MGPSWLHVAVIEGLQVLLTLRLRNSPAADTVEAVAKVWIGVFMRRPIGWKKERDAHRITEAFLIVAGEIDLWPSPSQVLACMPKVPEPLQLEAPRSTGPPEHLKAKLLQQVELLRFGMQMPRGKPGLQRALTPEEMNQALIERGLPPNPTT